MRPGRYDRAPPAPRRRWNLRATRRQQLLEELDAIIRTLTAIALAAPSPLLLATGEVSVVIGYMLMMTSWLTMISMALDFARTSASAFYAKRRLGAHGSGAMLPGHGPRRRVPPPTLDDWSDDLAVARTRFDVIQLRTMLHGFGLMRIDGSPKRYRVYQSGKLYSKKRPGGGFYKSSHAKYFHVQADTALILVLMYLAIPGRMCDLSQSMGGSAPSSTPLQVPQFLLTQWDQNVPAVDAGHVWACVHDLLLLNEELYLAGSVKGLPADLAVDYGAGSSLQIIAEALEPKRGAGGHHAERVRHILEHDLVHRRQRTRNARASAARSRESLVFALGFF
jgi:hypothetical protein